MLDTDDFRRTLQSQVNDLLDDSPVVALLGPRQAGKTTLALAIGEERDAIYLDLESAKDRSKLADPEAYLGANLDRLVILDEIHRVPELFAPLRGLIDTARRRKLGKKGNGRYLILGSASLDLLRQSSETLAGRLALVELHPFNITEVGAAQQDALWLRGGYPLSFTASSDARSLRWRQDFVRTYLEREISQFIDLRSTRIGADTLSRLWTMLAHQQGGMLNQSHLARNLGLDVRTINSYIDLLISLLLVRRLTPWSTNTAKRMVKSPKLYVRDSGIVHGLLGIGSHDTLLAHPVVGASWEGFCIDNLLACAPATVKAYFYRTQVGAEIDLLLQWPGGATWAIEFKRSLAPKLERGFHDACVDIKPHRKLLVYPGDEHYRIKDDVEVLPLHALCAMVREPAAGKPVSALKGLLRGLSSDVPLEGDRV